MEEQRQAEVRQRVESDGNETVKLQTVRVNHSIPSSVLAQRVIYYIGSAITLILCARFVLLLLGASQASSFVNFIYNLSGTFVAPFNGIFTKPTYGNSTFDSATLVAMIVYSVVIVAVARLLTIGNRNQDVA